MAGIPIAIIGMALRVPGAHSPSEFWSLLSDGLDTVSEIPRERVLLESRPGQVPPRRFGGFLKDLDQFDPAFFGISPREAAAVDPQQRMLLECAWEAFEDAGVPPSGAAGRRVGVFVGADNSDYWALQSDSPDVYGVMGGGARSAAAGRLSFAFDLRGPSLAVDGACASSLLAVTLACQSLRSGESELALAAGAHIVLGGSETTAFAEAGMLSADGHCKFGDASADGFVRSDAVGVILLKPLAAALADGDPIRAVIAGTGASNDGKGSGAFMAPAFTGQVEMLRAAYADAGIAAAEVDLVEAHGTGTQAGDPVELHALDEVLSEGRQAGQRAWVGSAKTNIGHAEAAAGVVGLIKAALCIQHRAVPPSLHFNEPNPAVHWNDLVLTIPRAAEPLDEDKVLVAGVSGFGVTGTNTHIVLTEARRYAELLRAPGERDRDAATSEAGPEQLLALSAQDPDALREQARFYLSYLRTDGRDLALHDICHTAVVRRDHHAYRLAVTGVDHESIAERLRETVHGGQPLPSGRRHRVAFVFPGQGSQWVGMGRELLESSPAFRAALYRCDEAVRAETGWSVIERLQGTEEDQKGIDVIQPLLWAMEVALAETWRAWGVEPDLVIGHSMGEAAAACVAGALTLAEGAAIICRRSSLMRGKAGAGAMVVTDLTAVQAGALLVDYDEKVSIAAVNGPSSTILSGDAEAIDEITERLEAEGAFCRRVTVDVASHSPQMEPLLDELQDKLADLRPTAAAVEFRSTVAGTPVPGQSLTAEYWAANLRQPVLFRQAVADAAAEAETVFLEISPHPVLTRAVQDSIERGASVPSLRREQPERATLLDSLAQLYTLRVPIDWNGLYAAGRCVPQPHYPWQRQRHWFEADRSPSGSDQQPYGEQTAFDPGTQPYLLEHRIRGLQLAPGTVFLDPVRSAIAAMTGGMREVALSDVEFHDALLVDGPFALRVDLTEADGLAWEFTVSGKQEGTEHWSEYCTGKARIESCILTASESPRDVQSRCQQYLSGADFYRLAAQAGSEWGEQMQAVTDVWLGAGEALARVVKPAVFGPADPDGSIHPAVFEACAQPIVALLGGSAVAESIGEAHYQSDSGVYWSHVRLSSTNTGAPLTAEVTVMDEAGRVVADMRGVRLRGLPAATAAAAAPAMLPETTPMHVTNEPVYAAPMVIELTGTLRLTLQPGAATPGGGAVAAAQVPIAVQVPAAAPAAPAQIPATPQFPATAPIRIPAQETVTAPATLAPAPAAAVAPSAVAAPVAAPATAPAAAVAAPSPTAAPAEPARRPDSPEELRAYLTTQVAEVLRMPVGQIDPERAPRDFGMDSLMALEIRKRIQRDLAKPIPTSGLLQAESLNQIATLLAAQSADETHRS